MISDPINNKIITVDEGVLIVLAMPKQLKHTYPQWLFVVNWNTDGISIHLRLVLT